MKNILKVILPVLAFTLASAGAVSTNNAKVKDAKKTVAIIGYIQNPSIANCLQVTVDCTTATTAQFCMSSEVTPRRVWHKNAANACNVTLFKDL